MSKSETEKKPSVCVLLSTYNGQLYLKEQIESILSQQSVYVDIYIRDDMSNDNTNSIISDCVDNYDNIHLLSSSNNMGPGLSFMTLLYEMKLNTEKYDYYAFADQDDIWLPEKLIHAINKIISIGKTGVLYSSNQILYVDGKAAGLRYDSIPDLTLKGHISKNLISGCTFVFDREMFEKFTAVPFPDEQLIRTRCHDSWLILEALLCGEVIYDEDSYILYRIHDNNAVGVKQQTYLDRINRFIFRSKQMKGLRSITARELLTRFPESSEEDLEVLKEFAYYKRSKFYKKRLLSDREITKFTKENRIIFLIKVMIGYV